MNFLAQYRLFLAPLPIYEYWFWLLLPLCLLFSIAYKAVKLESMRQVPRAAVGITIWILLALAAAGAALAGIVKVIE